MASTCKCISKIPAEVLGLKKKEGVKATAADLKGTAFFFTGGIQTISKIELTVEGKKRPVEINMSHSFCPFCGVAYEKEGGANG